jgi:glutamyl-tRNA(Gln) amidotransferase subunit D
MHEGDHIRFSYQGHELAGIIVQMSDVVTIKLDTGYNILVPNEALRDVQLSPAAAKPESPVRHIEQDTSLPIVSILHTGGTIASKVDYSTGAVTNRFSPDELLALIPELSQLACMRSKLLRNMASDDMRFAHYNVMARAVLEERTAGASGVIITHGTDTLHYTAAALSFALEGIDIPVMVVGSQRSSDRGSSDAAHNLIGALRFITQTKAPGVFVAMHETSADSPIAIIDGLHARKDHASRRDTFESVNVPLIARAGDQGVEVVDQARLDAWRDRAVDAPQARLFDGSLRVGLWKVHPQSFADELIVYDTYDGLLLEGTGLGHIPMNETDPETVEHSRIREQVSRLAKRIPVAIATQTIWGRINLNVYRPQRELKALGVLGDGVDMMPEVAYIKLAWLLSNHTPAEARELYGQDLRGEISSRSLIE